MVSILILLDYLFLSTDTELIGTEVKGLNPYFTGLSILIQLEDNYHTMSELVSILILLDYLFLYG